MSNYRPVSVLPVFISLRKSCVWSILNHLDVNNIITKSQNGFRNGRSTESALINFTNYIINKFESRQSVIAVILDLSKAFDTVAHDILLAKLNHYGVRSLSLNWFSNYLNNRNQCVKFQNSISSVKNIISFVPQESVISPILFILYINDIVNTNNLLNFTSYADDSVLYMSDANIENLINTLNIELNIVNRWLLCKKLTLNINKTFFLLFLGEKTI